MARHRLEGETVSKYWVRLNTANPPHDTIAALRRPGSDPPSYETKLSNMAEIARAHHENIQHLDCYEYSDPHLFFLTFSVSSLVPLALTLNPDSTMTPFDSRVVYIYLPNGRYLSSTDALDPSSTRCTYVDLPLGMLPI